MQLLPSSLEIKALLKRRKKGFDHASAPARLKGRLFCSNRFLAQKAFSRRKHHIVMGERSVHEFTAGDPHFRYQPFYRLVAEEKEMLMRQHHFQERVLALLQRSKI